MLRSVSFLTTTGAAGAFLKLGSFGLGLGAEKNEESDFASFTSLSSFPAVFVSFLTTGFVEDGADTAVRFGGGPAFADASPFRFLFAASTVAALLEDVACYSN